MIFDVIVLMLRFALVWLIIVTALFVAPLAWIVWALRRKP